MIFYIEFGLQSTPLLRGGAFAVPVYCAMLMESIWLLLYWNSLQSLNNETIPLIKVFTGSRGGFYKKSPWILCAFNIRVEGLSIE